MVTRVTVTRDKEDAGRATIKAAPTIVPETAKPSPPLFVPVIMGPGPGARRQSVAAGAEVADIDIGFGARDHVGDHPCRAAGHGPAQRAMAAVDIEIGQFAEPDDRRAVGR